MHTLVCGGAKQHATASLHCGIVLKRVKSECPPCQSQSSGYLNTSGDTSVNTFKTIENIGRNDSSYLSYIIKRFEIGCNVRCPEAKVLAS